MFLLSSSVCEAIRAHMRNTRPAIACGLLVGEKQGSITQAVAIGNCSSDPTCAWQLDPRQLVAELERILRDGLRFQGVYYIDTGNLPRPTPAMIERWRYNVPCFVVSQGGTSVIQIHAFSIDPIQYKATEISLWFEPMQE